MNSFLGIMFDMQIIDSYLSRSELYLLVFLMMIAIVVAIIKCRERYLYNKIRAQAWARGVAKVEAQRRDRRQAAQRTQAVTDYYMVQRQIRKTVPRIQPIEEPVVKVPTSLIIEQVIVKDEEFDDDQALSYEETLVLLKSRINALLGKSSITHNERIAEVFSDVLLESHVESQEESHVEVSPSVIMTEVNKIKSTHVDNGIVPFLERSVSICDKVIINDDCECLLYKHYDFKLCAKCVSMLCERHTLNEHQKYVLGHVSFPDLHALSNFLTCLLNEPSLSYGLKGGSFVHRAKMENKSRQIKIEKQKKAKASKREGGLDYDTFNARDANALKSIEDWNHFKDMESCIDDIDEHLSDMKCFDDFECERPFVREERKVEVQQHFEGRKMHPRHFILEDGSKKDLSHNRNLWKRMWEEGRVTYGPPPLRKEKEASIAAAIGRISGLDKKVSYLKGLNRNKLSESEKVFVDEIIRTFSDKILTIANIKAAATEARLARRALLKKRLAKGQRRRRRQAQRLDPDAVEVRKHQSRGMDYDDAWLAGSEFDYTFDPNNAWLEGFERPRLTREYTEDEFTIEEIPVTSESLGALAPVPASQGGTLFSELSANESIVRVYVGDKYLTTKIFGLCDGLCLINRHALQGSTECTLLLSEYGDRICQIDEMDLEYIGNDVYVMRIDLHFKNVMSMFLESYLEDGIYFSLFRNKCLHMVSLNSPYEIADKRIGTFCLDRHLEYDYPDTRMCGDPIYVSVNNNYYIAGIHSAGENQGSFCIGSPVNKSSLCKAMSNIKVMTESLESFSHEVDAEILFLENKMEENKYERGSYDLFTLRQHPRLYRNLRIKNTIYAYKDDYERLADLLTTRSSIDRILRKRTPVFSESMDADDGKYDDDVKIDENFLDVGGLSIGTSSAGVDASSISIGQYNTLSLDNFFKRPIEIVNDVIPLNTDIDLALPIWDLYTLNPTVRSKLRNYAYFKADLVVRISISGTPFHYGRVLVSYQPYPDRNATLTNLLLLPSGGRGLLLNYLSQSLGCKSMDVKANKPIEYRCPFISTKPMHRLYNSATTAISDITSYADLEEAGTLVFMTLNQIKSVSLTPSEVSVQIYAWAENVQLGCSTATQVQVTTESRDERDTGPVEKYATYGAQIMDHLSAVPYIEPVAKASSMILTGIGRIAAWFGWSRPPIIQQPYYVKNRPYANSSNLIGSETVERIVLDPKQELTVDPRVVATDDDEMSIASIWSRDSYLTTFQWSVGDPLMANPIFRCRVHPQLVTSYTDLVNVYYQPTAMSFAATPFAYWHGDIIFRFEIVVSAFHRGKLAVFYEPNINQATLIDADISANKNFIRIIDIQETQSVELRVNWASPRAWNFMLLENEVLRNYQNFSVATTEFAETYVNGYIGVVPFTEIQSPDGSDIDVNVYVRGADLKFNQLSYTYLPNDRVVYSESLFETAHDGKTMSFDLNDSKGTDEHIGEFHFGEIPVSFRACLHRYVTTRSTTLVAPLAGDRLLYRALIYPLPSPPYGGTGTAPVRNLFQYLRYAYVGMRGGMRKRIRALTDGSYERLHRAHVSIEPISQNETHSLTNPTGWTNSLQVGTAQFMPFTNGGIEVELPFYSPNLFSFSFADDQIGSNNTFDMVDRWSKMYILDIECATAADDLSYVIEDNAIAEDFCFLRFQGAPYYTTAVV